MERRAEHEAATITEAEYQPPMITQIGSLHEFTQLVHKYRSGHSDFIYPHLLTRCSTDVCVGPV
jgi:hypothetical protein